LIFGIVFLAVVCLAANARAYALEGQSWPQGSIIILQLNLGDPGRTLQDGTTSWEAAAAPAAEMWNAEMQNAHFAPLFDSAVQAASGDHVNSVVFATTVFGQSFGQNTIAVTYYEYSGSTMRESDTLLNELKPFDSYRGPLQYLPSGFPLLDIRRCVLHEFGHTLGLDHPDDAGQHVIAIMNSTIGDQEVLAPDDIAGIQFLYGAPIPPTPVPTPGLGSPSHLANISTRVGVGLGDNVLIGGFIINGTQSKTVLVRAIGPSLAADGVGGVLSDPVLELHSSSGIIASNDDWVSGSQSHQILGTGLAPIDPRESAIIQTLAPGNYTAVVSGYQNAQGIGLVEAYELDGGQPRLINISTRGRVDVGDNAMIGGLIVQGSDAKTAIVRALGPSLGTGPNPVAGALPDPVLEIHDSSGALLGSNDNWVSSSQYAQIVASQLAPTNPMESAFIATFGPGNYTAIVRGVNNATGIGLVEVYDLDP
jgi:hypothetical protein